MVNQVNLSRPEFAKVRRCYIKAFLMVHSYFVKDAAIEKFGIADLTVMKDIKKINADEVFMHFDKRSRSWIPVHQINPDSEAFRRAWRVLVAVEDGFLPDVSSL
ncbi:hypothetical protein SJU92_04140 [Aeromonas caviae]|uniref:hypothetical protein n=1 Tax=Aeromonas caviae TaxID=648 RepID=UPI0029D99544|nr:hypothetical protein [Aeromonas caviae]MDX7855205.1 hypothetical protein [Aeromonas caviae]